MTPNYQIRRALLRLGAERSRPIFPEISWRANNECFKNTILAPTAHDPLCSVPLRNNLAIELKSSLSIGSATRQSTLTRVVGFPAGSPFHVDASSYLERKREEKRKLGLDQIFTINGLPSPDPCRLQIPGFCCNWEESQLAVKSGPNPSRGGRIDSTVNSSSRTRKGCNLGWVWGFLTSYCDRSS